MIQIATERAASWNLLWKAVACQLPKAAVPEVAVNRDGSDLYARAMTDSKGAFSFANVVPGDFHIYSWEDIEPYSYYDSDVLREYEPRGKAVHISELSRERVGFRLIPAAASGSGP